jgi:membrane protease YdiL (CAAX protease family)
MSGDSSKAHLPVSAEAGRAVQGAARFNLPWNPWAGVIYAVLVFVAAQALAEFIVAIYPFARGWSSTTIQDWLSNSVVAQFWYVLFAEALTFGGIWLFMHLRGVSLRRIGWHKPRWWDVVVTLCGFFVYMCLYIAMVLVAKQVFPSLNVNQKQDIGFQSVSGNNDLLLTFLSLVILPPLVEETVFRGFIFTVLRGRMRWIWATLVTSSLFAVPHLLESGQQGSLLWIAGIDTFTLSLVLCYMREATDRLWPGVVLHMLKNGIAFISLFLVH